ncbi:MAG TPA: xanthine dehydrogenase small subunit [Bacteroidales bacterium]|nr:xanthine dehydrogenase small subunit [Bacteroidales bacterium]
MNKVRFVFNDQIQEVDFTNSEYGPTTSVLKYLRSLAGHKGVKEGCGEGDCGACTLVLAEVNGDRLRYKAVDSCLVFLPMIHGKQLITVENLTDAKGNLHPVQQAMVDLYASQCGYCTPGFVMSLFALYKSPLKPAREVILDSITGNLCRCTGYLPIIEAAAKACSKKDKDIFSIREKQTIRLLKQINSQDVILIQTPKQKYYKPFKLADALELKRKHPDALVISGNTDTGLRVSKKHELLTEIIDISAVEELKSITETKQSLSIGAGVSMEEIKLATEKLVPALHKMLTVFGSKQIRNLATMGGNIGSASPIGDTLPVLMACNAVVALSSHNASRVLGIQDFIRGYRTTDLRKDEIICSIGIPFPEKGQIIKSYKISKRKTLDISTCSAGFMLELNKKDQTVKNIILAFGGMAASTRRATNTENFLLGKKWTRTTVEKATALLYREFTPLSDARSGEEFRRLAARNLLWKFYEETTSKK